MANEDLNDPVLVRSSGAPTFFLASTSDDIHDQVSDLIRPDVLLRASAKQLHIWAALGHRPPRIDRLWWEPGEYRITGKRTVAERTMAEHDFRLLQEEIAGRDSWIIDGPAADLGVRLSKADVVVFLDPPRWLCTWQLVKRHNRRRPDYPDGVREGIGWFLFLARWIWRTYPTKRRPTILKAIAEHGGGAQVFWLRTRGEMRSFLDSLERST